MECGVSKGQSSRHPQADMQWAVKKDWGLVGRVGHFCMECLHVKSLPNLEEEDRYT